MSITAGRLYVGNIPASFTEDDVDKEFKAFGKLNKLELKKAANGNGYCFIEYEDARDARDAIAQLHGKVLGDDGGPPLRVEVPKPKQMGRGRDRIGDGNGAPPHSPPGGEGRGGSGWNTGVKRGNFVVEIAGIPASGSWQDLKDHFRPIGDVGYADVFGSGEGGLRFGEVSYFNRRDMMEAIQRLEGSTMKSHQGEKSRLSVREKRNNRIDDGRYDMDNRYGGRMGGGIPGPNMYGGGPPRYRENGADRRWGGGGVNMNSGGGGYMGGGYGAPPMAGGGGGGGYHRDRYPSPRGGMPGNDMYGDRRGRSRSRERRPGGGGGPGGPMSGGGYGGGGGMAMGPKRREYSNDKGYPADRRYDDRYRGDDRRY